ncbi:hypothetical protein [Curtobacterium sp. SGAir0471]|uniref:hypothetical protein n=1 Tax=Curtobacterium sp. SGAir0471 TaxID=2070337 RepID=UPI0010F56B02|nr:hypothetical protein [Curtobacterium sp. SGAir0471]
MKSDPGTPERSKPLSARGGFIAAGVLAVIGVLIAAVPLIAASTGNPIEGGYKLLGDATSGVLFGGVFLIAAVVVLVQAVRVAARNRRRR